MNYIRDERVLHTTSKVADKVSIESPLKWLDSTAYAKAFDAKWFQVYEQHANMRNEPVFYGKHTVNLKLKLETHFPAAGLIELRDAYVHGAEGWIFSKEGILLPNHSWYGYHVEEMKHCPKSLSITRRLSGVSLTLASDFAVGNYSHYLLDCLSRLELFLKAGYKLSNIDYVICPKPPSKNAQALFDQLSIPNNKIVWSDFHANSTLLIDTLLAPTFPGSRRNYPQWLPRYLQRQFIQSRTPRKRRLYISRTGYSRNAVNEAAVQKVLLKHNFEIYHGNQHIRQPKDFAEAAIVIGPHGAGLANLAFCQPGTKVLELMPSDHIYPYYYTLSDAANLNYSCLICKSTQERKPNTFGPSPYHFIVDEPAFEIALNSICHLPEIT